MSVDSNGNSRPEKALQEASVMNGHGDETIPRVGTSDWSGTPISVIIPAFNEENAIQAQIESIERVLTTHGISHEIIVVDDGSADQTAEKASLTAASVIQHLENRGYGASLKTGILAAGNDVIVIIDADGTYPAEAIPDLVAQLETADMVVGARIGPNVQIPTIRRPAKWLLGKLANHVAGQTIPDLNSGLRTFRRDTAKQYFSILSNRFSFTTTITLSFLADDYCVRYHPIEYYRRVGQSKVTPRSFMDFVILVLRMAMLFQPLKVFVPSALFCGLLGILKAVYDIAVFSLRSGAVDWSVLYKPVLSTSSILLLMTGLQLLLIGMLADGILRRMSLREGTLVPSHGIHFVGASRDYRRRARIPPASVRG